MIHFFTPLPYVLQSSDFPMNICWDFRLFSFAYARRGIGEYTLRVSKAALPKLASENIYIWADITCLPQDVRVWPVSWIPYTKSSWKRDLFVIPFIVTKYSLDIFHYWVVMGPIHHIGLGILHPSCMSLGTIYDCSIELWKECDFAQSKAKTWYFVMQKLLLRNLCSIIAISHSTKQEIIASSPDSKRALTVIYPPYEREDSGERENKALLLALGGSPNKNLLRTVTAFMKVSSDYPEFRLYICGDIDRNTELPQSLPENIVFDSMNSYPQLLKQAYALLVCSIHEGLGLPAIEALMAGCPVICSSIPSLKEICGAHVVYVDPLNEDSIVEGMRIVITNNTYWRSMAFQAAEFYIQRSKRAGDELVMLYSELYRSKTT